MPPRRGQRLALRGFLLAALGVDLEPNGAAIRTAAKELTLETWGALPAAADRHGITLATRAALDLISDVPSQTLEEIQARALTHHGSHLRSLVALERLLPLLDEQAGDWLVYKGLVLADTVYRVPGRRSFSDIDVLVPRRTVRGVIEALESDGAVLLTRNWKLIRAEGVCELSYRLPNGSTLDLHWDVLGSPDRVPGIRLDSAACLSRSRIVTVGTSVGVPIDVPTFEPTDQLLHLATHAVLAGMGPLRFCVDMDQAIRHQLPRVPQLVEQARHTGMAGLLDLALRRSAMAVGPSPNSLRLLSALDYRGKAWQGLMSGWNRVKPPQAAHEPGPLDFVIAATRENSSASLRALGAAAAQRLAAFTSPREALHRWARGSQDGTNLASWLHDVDEGNRAKLLAELDAA